MAERKRVEVYVLIDEAGDYVVSSDRDYLHDEWTDTIGEVPIVSRILVITLDVELPVSTALAANVPAAALAATMKVS